MGYQNMYLRMCYWKTIKNVMPGIGHVCKYGRPLFGEVVIKVGVAYHGGSKVTLCIPPPLSPFFFLFSFFFLSGCNCQAGCRLLGGSADYLALHPSSEKSSTCLKRVQVRRRQRSKAGHWMSRLLSVVVYRKDSCGSGGNTLKALCLVLPPNALQRRSTPQLGE